MTLLLSFICVTQIITTVFLTLMIIRDWDG